MKKILTFIIAALSALSLSACAATIGENVPEENPAAPAGSRKRRGARWEEDWSE